MSMVLYVALGGFFGALSRYFVSKKLGEVAKSSFPVGTFTVNMLGSFCLGLVLGSELETEWVLLLGTGFLGSFTTFSTFKLENIALAKQKAHKHVISYLMLSYGLGILLAYLGFLVSGGTS